MTMITRFGLSEHAGGQNIYENLVHQERFVVGPNGATSRIEAVKHAVNSTRSRLDAHGGSKSRRDVVVFGLLGHRHRQEVRRRLRLGNSAQMVEIDTPNTSADNTNVNRIMNSIMPMH